MKGPFAMVLIGCLLTACAGATRLPVVTQADANRVGLTMTQLEVGRSLYTSRCSSCHRAYEPARFARDVWAEQVERMRQNARLNDDEVRAVLDYLQTMCEVEPAGR